MNDLADDTDLGLLRDRAYADSARLDDRRALYAYQDPRPDFYGWILDQVDWPARGRVLDLGCGPGSQLARLSARAPALTLVAADLSTGMLVQAVETVPTASAVALDAGALPFDDRRFDVVMANHMLYHVADLDRTLDEVGRVLIEGGVLSAVTNAHDHLHELMDALAAVAGQDRWVQPSDRFRLDESARDLERHFSRVDVRHQVGELVVGDVEPLVAYVESMRPLSGRGYRDEDWAGLMADFERAVTRVIEQDGAMRITTHTGTFVCR